MRLSDVRGERVFDVLSTIIDPIANMAMDEHVTAMFAREEVPEGMTPWQHFLSRAKEHLPYLVSAHRDDLSTILAAIEGVDRDEYVDGLTLDKFMADVLGLLTDGDMRAFFA